MLILHPRQYRDLRNEAVMAIELGERAYRCDESRDASWWIVEPAQWIQKESW